MLIYAAVMYIFAYSGVEKFRGLLSNRYFARKMHTHYATFIREQTVENGRNMLKKREAVRQLYISGVLNVNVSSYGTWYKCWYLGCFEL